MAVTFCQTLAASLAARFGPIPMAAFQTCLQVWLTSSLLADGLAVAVQVREHFSCWYIYILVCKMWSCYKVHELKSYYSHYYTYRKKRKSLYNLIKWVSVITFTISQAILACSFAEKDYEKVIAAATRTLQMSFVLGVGLSLAVGVGLYFGAGIFSKSVLVVHLIRIGLPVYFCIFFTT